jgi:hypothetical protein
MYQGNPSTNYGNLTIIRCGFVTTNREHGSFWDAGIDDALNAIGDVVVDSTHYHFKVQGTFYAGAGETLYVKLFGIQMDEPSIETEQNWTRRRIDTNWTVAGGDTTGLISDTVKTYSGVTGWKVLRVTRSTGNAMVAGNWLDGLEYDNYNTGAVIIPSISGGDGAAYSDIWSEQCAVEADQPYLEVFYHMAEAPAGTGKVIGKSVLRKSIW